MNVNEDVIDKSFIANYSGIKPALNLLRRASRCVRTDNTFMGYYGNLWSGYGIPCGT